MASKYYAIKLGKNVNDVIVESWDVCKELVLGFPSIYKSFKTKEEAEKYLNVIVNVENKLESNKKAIDYNKKKKASTTAVTYLFNGARIPKEVAEEFENKCHEFGVAKEKILVELIKEWLC